VCVSVSVVLWEVDSEGQPSLTPTQQFKLDSEGTEREASKHDTAIFCGQ